MIESTDSREKEANVVISPYCDTPKNGKNAAGKKEIRKRISRLQKKSVTISHPHSLNMDTD